MRKKRKIFLILLFVSAAIKTFSQTVPVNDTIINTSEHSNSYDEEKRMIMARQSSSYLKKHAFLVALNKKIYEGEYLNQIILPYEQQFRRINIIQDKNIISKYTADPDILSIILISVNKRKARSMYLQLKEKGILDIPSQ